ncbi:hypothetical protein IGI04_034454 [Brassica rapa subsp. trilocularis]|uniref:Fatty acid desaturase domain-containing protein n=1 Tax=Brassica rapa subsp. trilocularis TaxID=1813537 RepID=A0ABQ7L8T0_BRACM|nr:hypothetical protein IGI04_034454 [Brassica rapa subsp. trilocularis]
MASLCTALKPLSPFSSFVKQGYSMNTSALFTYHTSNYTHSFRPKRGGALAVYNNAPDPVESSWKTPLSEDVKGRQKSAFWKRSWNSTDVRNVVIIGGFHLLSLLAPLYFSWAAFRLSVWLYTIFAICITLSYHRNLSHRSFDLPKWLEYLFAYGGVLAFQGDPIEWVSHHRYHHKHCDTQRDPHSPIQVWFGDVHVGETDMTKSMGARMPFLVWGMGVANVARSHSTFLVNSVCHTWGTRAWNTPDLSRNNWLLAILMFGEGWHNNHHAFEFSARHGLEWWQLDVTWYIISFLEAIGLATNVKLPSDAQKKKIALV